MARVIGKLSAPNGKYQKDGVEKTSWLNCGILLETDNGMRLKIECLPLHVPEGGLWLSVFEPDENRSAPASKPAAQKAVNTDDDIPF